MKKTAGVVVFKLSERGAKVLLVKETKGNTWSLPKGRVSGKESILDAALRETEEETGIRVKILRRLRSIQHPTKNKRFYFFAARVQKRVQLAPNSDEVSKAKFVPLSKAMKLVDEYQRNFLIQFQKHLVAGKVRRAS